MFIWWIGDHRPRHVHVFDKNDRRINCKILPSILEMSIGCIVSKSTRVMICPFLLNT